MCFAVFAWRRDCSIGPFDNARSCVLPSLLGGEIAQLVRLIMPVVCVLPSLIGGEVAQLVRLIMPVVVFCRLCLEERLLNWSV